LTFVGIDWGTSRLRVHLIKDGALAASRDSDQGLLAVPPGGFEDVLAGLAGDWLDHYPALACGMVGARTGWVEVPYCPVPASLADLGRGLIAAPVTRSGWSIRLVPGLAQQGGDPDVMRGEEVQAFGAVAEGGSGLLCLPGTHSKWITLSQGRITQFRTWMTGELMALLSSHSILGRGMDGKDFDARAFSAGLAAADQPGGLGHQLFGVRAGMLLGQRGGAEGWSYLSGLLIGHEVRHAIDGLIHPRVTLVAGAPHDGLYRAALSRWGVEVIALDVTAATTRGLVRLMAALSD